MKTEPSSSGGIQRQGPGLPDLGIIKIEIIIKYGMCPAVIGSENDCAGEAQEQL
jgi:hypothetical protein